MFADLIWLLATTLFYGLLLTYVVVVVPAAALTGYRRKWAYFFSGFITFGLAWIIGALEILSPSRRQVLIGAAAVLLIGFIAARPAVLIGVDGESLQSSVGGLTAFGDECRPKGEDWICWQYDDSFSGDRPYLVKVDRLGCWEATARRYRWEGPGAIDDPRDSGCISLFYLL